MTNSICHYDHIHPAMKRGWGIFYNLDLKKWEIQRIDELAIFKDDQEAEDFVRQGAKDGDLFCQMALKLVGITEEKAE